MAYSKQTWDTTSFFNPTRMNHIEDGIAGIGTLVNFKLSNIQIKTMYISSNKNITFNSGTYILMFLKNQYSQTALYTIETNQNPVQIGGNSRAITQSVNNNRITIDMDATYGYVILAKLNTTSDNDEINLVNGTT